MSTITPRPLSLHERYSLARALINHPHPLTFLVTYDSNPPSLEFLHTRVDDLQKIWPHLFARIDGVHTNNPTWIGGERPWASEEIVFHQPVPTDGGVMEREEVMHQESTFFRSLLTREYVEPSWRVTLYTSTNDGPSYLAFTIDHVIADGAGSIKLLQALTNTETHPPEDIPPKLEDTIDIRPPYATVAPVAWSKLVAPKLPSWFSSTAPPEVLAWPGPVTSPLELPESRALFDIPIETVDQFKALCKKKRVTLHPAIKTAWVWSLMAVLSRSRAAQGQVEISIKAMTPRSERKADLKHGNATGNYVSEFEHTYYHPSGSETRNFWETAVEIFKKMKKPEEIKAGQHRVGMLAYVPNHVNAEGAPTAWEEHWLNEARSAEPYDSGVSVSNLGYTTVGDGGGVCWMQPATPWGSVMNLNVIGHAKGLSVSATWRYECAITLMQVKETEELFKRMLDRLISGTDGYEKLVR